MQRVKRILIIVAVSLLGYYAATLVYGHEFRRAETLEDAHAASCRVSVSNARGTGSFIGVDKEKNLAIILTNYHVVTNNSRCTLDFWTNSVRQSVSGTVIARAYDANMPVDCALIGVDVDDLAKIDPPFLALGGKDAAPDANSYILSSGCPKGRFAQAWKGKVLGYYNGSTVMFQPGPVPGQSGSAIISEIDGELWVTGILTWLIGTEGADDSRGGAIPVANLYKAMQGRRSAVEDRLENLSPIPPGAIECFLDAGRSANGGAPLPLVAEKEKTPYVLEFSQDDCPPCVEAESDVAELRKAGVDVRTYNVSRSIDGFKLAKKHDVNSTPTFLVCDGAGKEFARFVGSGKAREILAAVIENTPKLTAPEDDDKQVADENSRTGANKGDALTLDSGASTSVEPSGPLQARLGEKKAIPLNVAPPATPLFSVVETEEDFRNRPPVYDFGDVGFFDDSNARWMNRGRRSAPPEDEPEIDAPEEEPAPKEEAPKLRDKLFGKDELQKELSGAIDGAIKKLEKTFDEKVNAKTKEIEERALVLYKKWRFRFALTTFVFLCVAVWFADFVKKGLVAFWEFLKTIVTLEDDCDVAVTVEKGDNNNDVQSDEKSA